MLIYLIFFLCFTILAFKNLHKAILLFAPISIICQTYMCLKYNSPAIILSFSIEFVLIFLLLIKKGANIKSCPLFKPLLVLSIVQIIGVVVSPLPILQTLPNVIVYIVSYYFIIVFYNEINDNNDIKLVLRTLIYVILLLILYSLIEFILQTNPFLKYLQSILPYEYLDGKLYYVEGLKRFFSIRCQSIFAICISWGGFCALMIAFLFYIKDVVKLYFRRDFIYHLILILSFCVFTTGTRSAFAYLGVAYIGGYSLFKRKTKLLIVLTIIIVLLFFLESLINSYGSSFNVEEDGGSSVAMRMSQLDAVFYVISENPIVGLGIKGYNTAFNANSDIIGAESIWLQLLISSGIVGVLSQVYMYYFTYNYLKQNSIPRKHTMVLMFVLGWVIFCTMTSSPGLTDSYYLIIVVIIGKLGLFQKKYILKTK